MVHAAHTRVGAAGEFLNEPLKMESLGVGGLDLQYNRLEEGSLGEMITDREGEAVKHANSTERITLKERKERRSERVCKKKNASVRETKQEMRSIPLQFAPYKSQNGEDKRLMSGERSPVLLLKGVRDRRFESNITRIAVQLGRG